ncbi:dihydropteroate synthase [Salinarchaeum chitinilyticum]
MEYPEASNFLFGLRRFGPKTGTESTADLLAELDDPHETVDFVQVAGSNGKGSTARMTERVLREAGCSVGLFTSPHLEDFRERIRVDGRTIPQRAVTRFVERTREYVVDRGVEGASPTFFETTTAMALWHFAQQDVDVAILEVGIGGRLDATSVVDPIASAVTNVSLEHTELLGESVEEIARDKAHVAPADRPLVTAAEGAALETLQEAAGDLVTVGLEDDRTDASDWTPPEAWPDVVASYGGRVNHTEAAIELSGALHRDGRREWPLDVETRLPVLGAHQAENAGVAAVLAGQVLAARDESLEDADLARGLRQAHWPARFEVLSQEPLVVLDGAHNASACERLAEVLAEFEYEELHLATGIMHDKPQSEMAAALPHCDRVVTCRPDLDRAEDPAVLAGVFEEAGADRVEVGGSVQGAVDTVLEGADSKDCVLVTGSLFTVAEARARWTRLQTPKQVDSLGEARTTLEKAGVTDAGVWRMRGKAVHRVVETRLQRRQAEYVKQELLALGGECAVSDVTHDGELLRVVLMGTLSQFRQLGKALAEQPYGLPQIGEELHRQLGIQVPEPEPNYPWQEGTAVMGICNVTPDSFHDGGEYDRVEVAVERAEAMVEAGADVVDVGGESTRPGADPVSNDEEIDRVVPVIERIADLDAMISIDTRKAEVAAAALEAGADIVNDVSGLEDPAMRFVAAEHDAPLVLMHSIDAPVDPDRDVEYDDVVRDVIESLHERVLLAQQAGLDREQILVDPGLGFGKSAEESFELLDRLPELQALQCPVLVGHSHKSLFETAGYEHGDRLEPTIAGTALAAERGADVVRVHDVPENVAAVRTVEAAHSTGGQ